MMKNTLRASIGLATLAAAVGAAAHTGHVGHGVSHEAASLFTGLAHPLGGADHLLAMVAVGLWSAAALPAGRRLAGPLAFLLALAVGAVAGVQGLGLPLVEAGVAASVLLMAGLMLARRQLPAALGLALVAGAGLLHGLAHGAEAPAAGSLAAYGLGFLATSALLHAAGLGLGRQLLALQAWVWRLAAAGMGAAGLLMLARV